MRLIDADALVSILEEWEEKACDGTENDGSDGTTRVLDGVPTTTPEMIDLIADQPTIEVEPVKHGRWIFKDDDRMPWCTQAICSHCKKVVANNVHLAVDIGQRDFVEENLYCPHCGAKMDGGKTQ